MKDVNKLYILHGWTYSLEKWLPFVHLLEKNNVHSELLYIPGLTAPLDEEWDLDNYVEWLHDIVSKEKEPVVLLGHSNGGRIIISFTAKYPQKVKQLILIDSAGVHRNDWQIRTKRFLFGSVLKIGKKLADRSVNLDKVLSKLKRGKSHEASEAMQKTMSNLINVDLLPVFSDIDVPTVIIWGEEDKITPLSDAVLMNKEIKNSSLNIITGARHSPQFTHLGEVGKIVLKELGVVQDFGLVE
jgi:pimeloyl-ACP methyl ester carboxylesterase